MGNTSSSDESSAGLGLPNLLSKVHVGGNRKADVDAFLSEGRVDNVSIAYNTKKQVQWLAGLAPAGVRVKIYHLHYRQYNRQYRVAVPPVEW